jgi:parallel beta-helix repeat protein
MHSTDNVVDNLYLHGHNGSGMGSSNSSRNRVSHCTSENNFDEATDGENADGFAVSSGGENTFEFCVAFNNSDDGFDMWESVNNEISNCVAYANGRGTAGDGNGFKLGGRDSGGGNLVTRCIAYENAHSGFSSNTGDNNYPCTLYNNTAYANETGFSLYTLPHVARNNLAYDNERNGVQEIVDDLGNSWNDPPGIVLEASDFQSLDPAGIETLFLRLAPGSGAIDAGTDVGLPFSGDAPDLGSFEFDGG